MTDNNSPFCDLQLGRARLDAMRAEEQNTSPHEPRPEYVRWLVWARENAEAMLNCIEVLTEDCQTAARPHCGLCEPIAETRTEWGVRRAPKYGCTVVWMDSRASADGLVQSWEDAVVVSRTVTAGHWTEVEP